MSNGKRPDVAQSLRHGQLERLTGRRLGGDADQLVDDDDGHDDGGQRVEDADRPDVDVASEHVRRETPVDDQRAAGVTPAQRDGGRVLERGEEGDADEQERDEVTPRVGGDAAVDVETMMITTIDAATTQSTVSAVHRRHRLTSSHALSTPLAVASIVRDDPSLLPGMHRDHNALPSQTDGRTLTSQHKREMYILRDLALKMLKFPILVSERFFSSRS